MNSAEKIQELKKLYGELIELLNPYYKPYNALGGYMDVSENIINYLNSNIDEEGKILQNVWLKDIRGG